MTNDNSLPIQWEAWAIRHDAHGPSIDTLVWLPEGDEPETNKDWVRLTSLDFAQLRPFTGRTNVR